MYRDKRTEAAEEERDRFKAMYESSLKTINKLQTEIKELKAEKGIMERMVDISRRDLQRERSKRAK